MLLQGPDISNKALRSTSKRGIHLLDWMLSAAASDRPSANEVLGHQWLKLKSSGKPLALWNSTNSEMQFLKIMGVFGDSRAESGIYGNVANLNAIQEHDDEGDRSPPSAPTRLSAQTGTAAVLTKCSELIKSMAVPVTFADPDLPGCPMVLVSRAFEKLTGYSSERIVGRSCSLLSATRKDEFPLELRIRLQTSIREKSVFLGVVPNSRADGSPFENLLHISPITLQSSTFLVGIQMEVADSSVDPVKESEIVGISRRVHSVVRHWVNRTATAALGQQTTRPSVEDTSFWTGQAGE
jgi:PAS domain S-box-containing protein